MNNMAGMPNMNPMGGPVGGPMNMMNNGALAHQPMPPNPMQLSEGNRTLLNTYIYEYFVRYGMFKCARAVYQEDPQIRVKKDSPGKHENGNMLGNGLGDDPMDTDSKDALHKRPDDLPAPNVPSPLQDSCFLFDWFCLFWDMFHSQKGKGPNLQVNQYVQHTQQQSRLRQEQQRDMLRQMRPDLAQQQQFQSQMMRGIPVGAMNMGMKPGNQLQRAAMANNQNPQMQMLHQQKVAGQMQRDPSDMDGNRARPASPGGAENAPSPSKRPRLDGGAPFNPNQTVMMPNGARPGQGMPGQQQAFGSAAPQVQAKIASYSTNMSQHHGNQMPNKPMPNTAGPQGQGSPMVQQGPDSNSLTQYYNHNPGDMGPGNMRPAAANGQPSGASNHALQDYQMQLMLLEQQNKKRLMMARQEQDLNTNNGRIDGPGGPGGPGGPPGPNGQAFQGTSPPGGRSGASPNPAEQMKRASQQMANAANMGSPLPDSAQSRSSPNSMNFMGANMDPNGAQHFGMNMNMAAQMNGAMRPPSSHPPFNGQMNQQQMLAAQRQAQQPGAQGAPMQWAQGGPNGQMAGQPPQPQVPGGPVQNQRAMPPPSAPAAVAANARNTTASPQVSNAAPPTPQQASKPAPKKKETKSAKAKAAAQKKSNPNLNAASTTPAPDTADGPQEAPTPATPMTPVNPAGFPKNVNPGQVVPNGQPAAPAPPPQPAPPLHADPNQSNNFMDPGGMDFPLDFANPMQTENVLNDFDFDSFLQDGNPEADHFDFGSGFTMEGDTGIGATD